MNQGPDDAELLARFARDGDQPAFAELTRRHIAMVREACLRRLHGRRDRADDATQAVFLILACKAATVPPGSIGGWLYRTAERVAMHAGREDARRLRREREAAEEAAAAAAADDGGEVREALHEAIARLGRKQQDAIVLHYLEGRSVRDTAQALQCAEEAARKRIAHGLASLRRLLGRRPGLAEAAWLPLLAPAPPADEALVQACTGGSAASAPAVSLVAAAAGGSGFVGAVVTVVAALAVVGALLLPLSGMRPASPKPQPHAAAPPVTAAIGTLRVDVCWRSDRLADALDQLCVQTGLWYALPEDALPMCTTWERDGTTLAAALARIASDGGLALELGERAPGRPFAVFRRRTDDRQLAEVLALAVAPEVDRRRRACVELTRFSDARAVEALARLAADERLDVSAIARRELAQRGGFVTRLPRVGLLATLPTALRHELIGRIARDTATLSSPALHDTAAITGTLGDATLAERIIAWGQPTRCVDALATAGEPRWDRFPALLVSRPGPRGAWAPHAYEALRVLSALHDDRAARILSAHLLSEDPARPSAGASGMHPVDPRCLPALLTLLERPEARIDAGVVRALARTRDPAAFAALRARARTPEYPMLMELAEARHPLLTIDDIPPTMPHALARSRLPGTCERLRAWIDTADGSDVAAKRQRRECVMALTACGDAEAVDHLLSLMSSPVGAEEPWAVAAMVVGADAALVAPRLLPLIPRLSPGVLDHIAASFGQCQDARYLDCILALDPARRVVAMSALGRLRHPTARARLLALDGGPDRVRWCQALGEDASPAALQALIPLLSDAQPAIRAGAAAAIGRLRDPAADDAIATAFARTWGARDDIDARWRTLADGEHGEWTAVAEALAATSGAAALPTLIGRLRRCDIRHVPGFGYTGAAEALASAIAIAASSPEPLRAAMAGVTDPPARARLDELLKRRFGDAADAPPADAEF